MKLNIKEEFKLDESIKTNNLKSEEQMGQICRLELKDSDQVFCSIDREQEIFEEVRCGNKERVFELLEEMFDEMQNSGLNKKLIKTRCLEITIMLSRAAVEGGVRLETTLHLNQQLIKEMNQTIKLEEKFNLTKNFIKEYIDLNHQNKKMKNLEIIQKVKKFVQNNYSNKITLDQIADHVYLSPSYLSKIFKEITGLTIIEYVTQVRLKKIKRLLRQTEMSLKDIAQITGYYDASYLSKVFKQEESITPGQYRANAKSNKKVVF